MLAGHLAVALASTKVDRAVPLGAAVAAAFGLDLLWPLFLLLGIETVQVNPGDTAFTLVGLLVLIGGVWVTQPWSPPPPSATAVAWGGLVLWLLPAWAGWIERHRGDAGPSGLAPELRRAEARRSSQGCGS